MVNNFVAIDFETADYQADSACAIGMAKVQGGEIVAKYYSLIRPPRSRVYFSNIHGLTWKMLKNSPSFVEIWPEMSRFWQGVDYFVAHNASFDQRILRGCCESMQCICPSQPFICTLKGSRQMLGLKSNSLDAVCQHFGFDLIHHQAEEDAVAAAKIFLKLVTQGWNFM